MRHVRLRGQVVGRLALLAILALVSAACGGGGGGGPQLAVVEESAPVTHEYVIPYGTKNRLEGGEQVELVPQVLDVSVGDSIRIRNEDAWGSQVGIFHVGAGETVTMQFKSPGQLKGACDVHPSGEFTINVADA